MFLLNIITLGVLCVCVNSFETFPNVFNGRPQYGSVGNPYGLLKKLEEENDASKKQWVTQKVDNFNDSNTATWENLYYCNEEYYVPGGPVFFMFRGEAAASPAFMTAGAWIQYAQQFNAMLFQIEHRFYGSSMPTSDLSSESLKYLTSEQALADAAHLIDEMNIQHQFAPDVKWVMFGGSYAGALALWMREKYPDRAYGSISSSGPIAPTVNFHKYLEAVTGTLEQQAESCGKNTRKAFSEMQQMMQTSAGQIALQKELGLCEPLSTASELDRQNMMNMISGHFGYVVQYNRDNTDNDYVTVAMICKAMTNDALPTPLQKLSAANKLYMTEMGSPCVYYNYESLIIQLRNDSINAPCATSGSRQWFFQTCNEFGLFRASMNSPDKEAFGDMFPMSFFVDQCTEVFGRDFNLRQINEQNAKTNDFYGGLYPNATRVLAVQGTGDPWREVGYTKNYVPGVKSLLIQGTGHVADVYAPAVTDSPALQEARVKIVNYLNAILNGQLDQSSSTITQTSSLQDEVGSLGKVLTGISKAQTHMMSSIVSLPSLKSKEPALPPPPPALPDFNALSLGLGLGDTILGTNPANAETRGQTETNGLLGLGGFNLDNLFESPNVQEPNQFTLPAISQPENSPQNSPTLQAQAQPSQKITIVPPTSYKPESTQIVPPTSYTPTSNTQSDKTPVPSSSPKSNSTNPPDTDNKALISFTVTSVVSANTLSKTSATSSSSSSDKPPPVAVTPSESEFYNQNPDQDPGINTPERDSTNVAAENAAIDAILNPKKPVKALNIKSLEGKNSVRILNLIDIHEKQVPTAHKPHRRHHVTKKNITKITNLKAPKINKKKVFSEGIELEPLPHFPAQNITIETHSTTFPQLAFAKSDAFSVESTNLSLVQLPSFVSSSNSFQENTGGSNLIDNLVAGAV